MAGQYIPLPEHAPPPLPRDMPPAERVKVWLDLLRSCERLQGANLRRAGQSEAQWQEAIRRRYEQETDARLAERLRQRDQQQHEAGDAE